MPACSQMPTVRNATRQDLSEILSIYNEVIRNSTAVYSEIEFTPARGDSWFDAKTEQGFPFIVAQTDTGIAGFGTFGEFRAWPCYRHTVEHSVHIRADRRGQCDFHRVAPEPRLQAGGPLPRGGVQIRALARFGVPGALTLTGAASEGRSEAQISLQKSALQHSCSHAQAMRRLYASQS
jgi:hypothetical protein